jgi:iron-sulfur cluster assembly protein
MITVTENAAGQIQKLLVKHEIPQGGLRVGVKAGGCSGFEYTFGWEPAPRADDLVFSGPDGVRVWIDPRSHRVLDGTTLDYDTSLLSRGFVFQNPQAKSTCGCGTSFSI